MHRAARPAQNAKLSALSSRYAKSLKRVLSRGTKLSLYSSDSYPIHYTAGYSIYYADEYIRCARVHRRVGRSFYFSTRVRRARARILRFFLLHPCIWRACARACVSLCVCVCVCVYVCIYIYIYTYTYMYIYVGADPAARMESQAI